MPRIDPEVDSALRDKQIRNHLDFVGPVVVEGRLILAISIVIDSALSLIEKIYFENNLPEDLSLEETKDEKLKMGRNWNSAEWTLYSLLVNSPELIVDPEIAEYAEKLADEMDEMRKIWRHEIGVLRIVGYPTF